MAAASAMLTDTFGLIGTRLGGRYDIASVVAEGGFGVVYRAVHGALGLAVAVKVLKVPEGLSDAMQGEFVAAFEREARTLVRVDHPAVVRVLDFGVLPTPAGREAPWMALEWVEGINLSEWLAARRGRGGMAPAEALALLTPVFEALVDAHARGVVHRDLKPANIRLTLAPQADPEACDLSAVTAVRLLDFGIAKEMALDESAGSGVTLTASPLHAYSLSYAAPEQVGAARSGPWTDVHAMGLLLTELMTDQAPFAGADRMEVQFAVMSPERPTPGRFGVDVGPVEAVLRRAVRLRPAERYQSVGEMLRELAPAVAATGRPTRAPRPRSTSPRLPVYRSEPADDATELSTTPAPPRPPATIAPTEVLPPAAPVARAPRRGRWPAVALALSAVLAAGATLFGLARRGSPAEQMASDTTPTTAATTAHHDAAVTATTAHHDAPVAAIPARAPTVPAAPADAAASPDVTPQQRGALAEGARRRSARVAAPTRTPGSSAIAAPPPSADRLHDPWQ